ncbi:MAG: PadR family transcriptional regulator PadR [Dokdonia sp.]|jgi:PadR family transcriptional regulator PadR
MKSNKYIQGFLEDIVLQMIKDSGKMYGYQITQRVKELTQGEISFTEGALYPVLNRLEAKDLLTVSFEKGEGRVRKYYEFTPQGGQLRVGNADDLAHFLTRLHIVFNVKLA